MEQKLRLLYNTLLTIETKGKNTITMADCLKYTEQLIAEENARVSREAQMRAEPPVERVEAEVVE